MTKNLPLRKMHFMAQRVRAAEQAMQRKEDCSRPLAQGLCGGIPHDVQDVGSDGSPERGRLL